MAFDKKGLDDYVDVATRIAEFRALYPSGSLAPLNPAEPFRLMQVEGWDRDGSRSEQTFVVVVAAAYRDPGDARPGVGMAWEVFPGRTPYTRGSELMNAETSAWGRAIIAVGAADSRAGIASREEVRNRSAERDDGLPVNSDGTVARSKLTEDQRRDAGIMTNAQTREHGQLRKLEHPRPAERMSGPLPDDEWTGTQCPETLLDPGDGTLNRCQLRGGHKGAHKAGVIVWNGPGGEPGERPGTSTLEQQRDIATRLAAKGVSTREEKLAFCSAVAGRTIGSSKELSYVEAVEALRRTSELPAVTP